MRKTAEQREGEQALRAVLEFLDENVATMKPKRLEHWREYFRRFWPGQPGDVITVSEPLEESEQAAVALLSSVQATLQQNFRALLRPGGDGWEIPGGALTSTLTAGRRKFHMVWSFKNDADKILAGVADLVRSAISSRRLRICAAEGCPRVAFVAERGHAVFCGSECQQREMNRRKAVARKDARRRAREGK